MRDRQYYASLAMFVAVAFLGVGGLVSLSWLLGWLGAAGLLALLGGFLGWFYWGPRPDMTPKGQGGLSGWRRDD